MKIAVCSDLHLEFGDIELENTEGADVLILGGDIFIAKSLIHMEDTEEAVRLVPTQGRFKAERYFKFIERCSQRFPNVILIAGNHEHYHGDYMDTYDIIRRTFKDMTNVHVLDKESTVIDGMIFVGGTLWTDMNKEDPITIHAIRSMMNDFNCVSNGTTQRKVPLYKKDSSGKYLIDDATGGYIAESFKYKEEPRPFTPTDALEDHRKYLQYLNIVLENNVDKKPVIVVGHHAPSRRSTHPRYVGQDLMNGGYSSELSELILDHPEIKLWTHGHTHENFDYMIGDTRIVCNPRGYINYERGAEDFKLKFIEV